MTKLQCQRQCKLKKKRPLGSRVGCSRHLNCWGLRPEECKQVPAHSLPSLLEALLEGGVTWNPGWEAGGRQ